MVGRGRSMVGRGRSHHQAEAMKPETEQWISVRGGMDTQHSHGNQQPPPAAEVPGADSDPVLFPWGLPLPSLSLGFTGFPGALRLPCDSWRHSGWVHLAYDQSNLIAVSVRGPRVVPLTFHLARLRQCWRPWVSSLNHPTPPSSP